MSNYPSEPYNGPSPMDIEPILEEPIYNPDSAITNLRIKRERSSNNRIRRQNSSSGIIPTTIEEEPAVLELQDATRQPQNQNQESIFPPIGRPPVRSLFNRLREPLSQPVPMFQPEDFPPLPSLATNDTSVPEEPQSIPQPENPHQHDIDAIIPSEGHIHPLNNPLSRGAMIIRTIHPGADGTMIVRLRVIPMIDLFANSGENNEGGQHEDLGIIGALMGMLAGIHGGRTFSLHNLFHEEHGLEKEDMDSLPVVTYTTEGFKNVEEESKKCPICLDCFEDGNELRYLWCLHRFHKGCVDQWLDKHTTCPICKKDYFEAQKEKLD